MPRLAKTGHFLMESFVRVPEISAIPIDQNADISIRDQSHRSHALFRRAFSNTQVSKYTEHTENPVPHAEQGSVLQDDIFIIAREILTIEFNNQ